MKTLLARVNARLALLRGWLSHDHGDEAFWWARRVKPHAAQREREFHRIVANLLHVERATRRARLHGTRFANLDEQRAWLESWLDRAACAEVAGYAGVEHGATLRRLLAGELRL